MEKAKPFDYTGLDEGSAKTLQGLLADIRKAVVRETQNCYILGRLFTVARMAAKGHFQAWYESEFPGLSKATIYRYIAVYEVFLGAPDLVKDLQPSECYLLVSEGKAVKPLLDRIKEAKDTKAKAEDAKAKAEEASTKAEEAKRQAEKVLSDSKASPTAKAKAEEQKRQADEAKAKADEAKAKADEAKAKADENEARAKAEVKAKAERKKAENKAKANDKGKEKEPAQPTKAEPQKVKVPEIPQAKETYTATERLTPEQWGTEVADRILEQAAKEFPSLKDRHKAYQVITDDLEQEMERLHKALSQKKAA